MKSFFLMPVAVLGLLGLSIAGTGCSDPLPTPPRAILEGTVSKPSGTNCPIGGAGFQIIGSFAATSSRPRTEPIQDGQVYEGAVVNVACRVFPNPDGTFDFASETRRQGSGTISLRSPALGARDPSKIRVAFAGGDLEGTYSQDDCEFKPYHPNGEYDATVNGQPTKLPDLAAGRIWGRILCKQIVRTDLDPVRTCQADVDFRFENCEQPKAN
jgi:hypothetical protein